MGEDSSPGPKPGGRGGKSGSEKSKTYLLSTYYVGGARGEEGAGRLNCAATHNKLNKSARKVPRRRTSHVPPAKNVPSDSKPGDFKRKAEERSDRAELTAGAVQHQSIHVYMAWRQITGFEMLQNRIAVPLTNI